VELVEPGLTGDGDHRGVVEIRIGDPGDEVGRTGPEGGHGDGGPARQPAVDVGHERGALLVTSRDMAHGSLLAERLEDVHRLLARHREDVLAGLGGETLDEQGGGRSAGLDDHGRSLR
jgi:hypothetical protein